MKKRAKQLPTVRRASPEDAELVEDLQRDLAADAGYRGISVDYDAAWIVGERDGLALFDYDRRRRRWVMTRGWVRPELRRKGIASAAWRVLRRAHGDFDVERSPDDTPSSKGGEPFLRRHGHRSARRPKQ